MNWCQYFKGYKRENIIPDEYTKNFRVINSLVNSKKKYHRKKEILETFPMPDFNIEIPTVA